MIHVADETLFMGLEQTIQAWARSLEVSGREPEGHTYRVADLTLRFARKLGIPDEETLHMVRGALLHDVGKLAIPESILLKPGKLDPAERVLVEQHPFYAKSLLQAIEVLANAIDIPLKHHERWDGRGYPSGLQGESIPIAARMFAIIDVWDSLLHDQPYRSAWLREDVVEHMLDGAGTQFDPNLVGSFLVLVEDVPSRGGVAELDVPLSMLLRA